MARKKDKITPVMADYSNTRASQARKANAGHSRQTIARIDGETKPSFDTYSQQDTPLLNLPKEIQNRIVELVSSNTTVKSAWSLKPRGHLFGLPKPPGTLMSCKQIYHETIKTFYNNAVFQFDDLNLFRSWLRTVSCDYVDLVKRLNLWGSFVRIEEGRLVTEKQQRPFVALEGDQWYGGDEVDRHNYMGKSMRRRVRQT